MSKDQAILPVEPLELTITGLSPQAWPVNGGAFSDIYRVSMSSQHDQRIEVALKVLRITNTCDRDRALKRLRREAGIWNTLSHPNIAIFYGISYSAGGRPGLVLMWYNNGSASEYAKGKSLAVKLRLIKDIANGLAYLHSQDVVHGDIKASNVLVTDNSIAVITDFGLSRVTDTLGLSGNTTSSAAGSIRWQAPELFIASQQTTPFIKQRTKASDVWAFACTVYELLTETLPYCNLRDTISISKAVCSGKTPVRRCDTIFSTLPDLKRLLRDCWHVNAQLRPSMAQVLAGL